MDKDQIFKSSQDEPEALLKEFFDLNPNYSEQDKEKISRAWDLLLSKTRNVKRACGKAYYLHPLRVANILAINKLDADTIIAAILHPIHKFGVDIEVINQSFGQTVANILVTTNKIISLPLNSRTLHQSEAIRKMLFAMCDDARVILLTLSDRLDRIRNITSLTQEQQRALAEGVIEIWAPLADRLGMQKEKNEFEDLSLKYTNPKVYKQIQEIVAQSQEERAAYLDKAVQSIYKSTEKMGLHVTITSRAKHFYSIYQKMRKRNKSASELYDLLALRILCQTQAECYMLIGIVHGLWKPLDGRFKDYIAMPKPNMYQSLHTTILSGDGHVFEIQIRTKDMDETAEGGVAAHWRYKEGISYDPKREQKEIESQLHWFKDFIAMTDEQANNETAKDYVDSLQHDIFDANVYVFTPKGKVISLPNGSTPIDFAYRIHTKVGDTLAGAKVNNKLVPLSTVLKTGDMVEIKTSDNASPNTEWLNIAKSSFARSHIRKYLAKQNTEFIRMDQIEKGKASLRDSLKERKLTLGFEKLNDKKLLSLLKVSSVDDLFLGINSKNIVPQQIIDYFELESKVEFDFNKDINKKEQRLNEAKNNVDSVLLADGSSAMISLASCCTPIPGDDIVGYITKGNGIKVHRKDCPNIKNEKARLIDVVWNYNVEKKKYPVDFQVDCTDRPNLLVDIMNAVNSIGASLININAKFHSHTNTTTISCTVLIYDNDTLEKLFQNIRQIKSVIELHRVQH